MIMAIKKDENNNCDKFILFFLSPVPNDICGAVLLIHCQLFNVFLHNKICINDLVRGARYFSRQQNKEKRFISLVPFYDSFLFNYISSYRANNKIICIKLNILLATYPSKIWRALDFIEKKNLEKIKICFLSAF